MAHLDSGSKSFPGELCTNLRITVVAEPDRFGVVGIL